MKVYLSGPMSGIEQYNIPAFNTAAGQLRSEGHEVFVPHEADEGVVDGPWEGYLRRDLVEILIPGRFDMVVVLPGWLSSRGSQLEIAVAQAMLIPVVDYETRTSINQQSPLKTALHLVYGPRHDEYGDAGSECLQVVSAFNVLRGTNLKSTDVALLMILLKMSREVHHHKEDNLADMAGYVEVWSQAFWHGIPPFIGAVPTKQRVTLEDIEGDFGGKEKHHSVRGHQTSTEAPTFGEPNA